MKLVTAKLMTEPDANPDFSDLGYFTNDIPTEEMLKDRRAFQHRTWDPSTLDFFACAEVDESLPERIKTGMRLDMYERMLAHEEGEWHMLQVWLEIVIEIGGTNQKIVSSYESSIPSDCDCLGEHAESFLEELEPVLKELGFFPEDVLALGLEI